MGQAASQPSRRRISREDSPVAFSFFVVCVLFVGSGYLLNDIPRRDELRFLRTRIVSTNELCYDVVTAQGNMGRECSLFFAVEGEPVPWEYSGRSPKYTVVKTALQAARGSYIDMWLHPTRDRILQLENDGAVFLDYETAVWGEKGRHRWLAILIILCSLLLLGVALYNCWSRRLARVIAPADGGAVIFEVPHAYRVWYVLRLLAVIFLFALTILLFLYRGGSAPSPLVLVCLLGGIAWYVVVKSRDCAERVVLAEDAVTARTYGGQELRLRSAQIGVPDQFALGALQIVTLSSSAGGPTIVFEAGSTASFRELVARIRAGAQRQASPGEV